MTNREIFIVLCSNDTLKISDAIILLEGDGYNRVEKTISLFKQGWAPKIVVSGGYDNEITGSLNGDKLIPILIENGIKRESIIYEKNSMHTDEQANNIIDLCIKFNWKKIILVASNYHQYRAYFTFFRKLSIKNLERSIEIINAPADNLSWFIETGWGIRYDLLQLEFEKIEKYFKEDYQLYYNKILDYFKWKNLKN
jgi:uncharacterized SAM-binding protein YcdF (DUF218 family)